MYSRSEGFAVNFGGVLDAMIKCKVSKKQIQGILVWTSSQPYAKGSDLLKMTLQDATHNTLGSGEMSLRTAKVNSKLQFIIFSIFINNSNIS